MNTADDSLVERLTNDKNWGAESWRSPAIEEGETIVFSEHGRVLDNVCYRAYWLMLIKERFGGHALLVKHGGGQERISLFSADRYRLPESLALLDSDARYLMLYQLYRIHTVATRNASAKTRHELMTAFAEGRLKKRKVRGQNAVKVEIQREFM